MNPKARNNVIVITLFIAIVSFVGYEAKQHSPAKVISPIPDRAYAMDSEPVPTVVIMAPESEQENSIRIIKKIWGKDWKIGVGIAKCESGLRAKAVNRNNTNGSTDTGLFQINSIHGWSEEELLNPVANAGIAYSKFIEQGTGPWYSSERCWK